MFKRTLLTSVVSNFFGILCKRILWIFTEAAGTFTLRYQTISFKNEYGEENLKADRLFTYHIKVWLSSVVMCLWRTTNWSPAFARLVNVVFISWKLVCYIVKNPLVSHRLFEFLPKSNHYDFNLFQLFVLKLIQEIKTKLNCS